MELKLKNRKAEIFIPDNLPIKEGIERTTHLGISAHPDDLEILAYDGIIKCFGKNDKWFLGVIITDGAGSPRTGRYEKLSDEEMIELRNKEQKKASTVGEYGGIIFLNYSSAQVKDSSCRDIIADLKEIISLSKPKFIYTHNLADKHDTHVAVTIRTIQALRELLPDLRPTKFFGCEVWRSLDWMLDDDKVFFDVSGFSNIESALLGIFDSQIGGGKRYDLATIGRRRANATYFSTHEIDIAESAIYAMDLTPLINEPFLDLREYVSEFIERFRKDVQSRIEKLLKNDFS